MLTRGLALIPAVIVTAVHGEKATAQLLVFSQVVLSIKLPFAIIPLVILTADKAKMGDLATGPLIRFASALICLAIVIANLKLMTDVFL